MLSFSDTAKILCLFPSQSKSHLIIAQALMKELAGRGHSVTVVSPYQLSEPVPNYRDVHIDFDTTHHGEAVFIFLNYLINKMVLNRNLIIFIFTELITKLMKSNLKQIYSLLFISKTIDIAYHSTNDSINSPQFKKLMAEESFDLMILGTVVHDYLLGMFFKNDLICDCEH